MVQRQGSGSHVVILLAGVAVGFFIGVRVGAGGGPQQRMRALVCNSYAGAESVAVTEDLFAANASSCGPDEVLVEVKASSIDPVRFESLGNSGRVRISSRNVVISFSQFSEVFTLINFKL